MKNLKPKRKPDTLKVGKYALRRGTVTWQRGSDPVRMPVDSVVECIEGKRMIGLSESHGYVVRGKDGFVVVSETVQAEGLYEAKVIPFESEAKFTAR